MLVLHELLHAVRWRVWLQDPSPANILHGSANGFAAAQIFYDAFDARFGSGLGGIILLVIPGGAMLL